MPPKTKWHSSKASAAKDASKKASKKKATKLRDTSLSNEPPISRIPEGGMGRPSRRQHTEGGTGDFLLSRVSYFAQKFISPSASTIQPRSWPRASRYLLLRIITEIQFKRVLLRPLPPSNSSVGGYSVTPWLGGSYLRRPRRPDDGYWGDDSPPIR
jgi:hypothetical protein